MVKQRMPDAFWWAFHNVVSHPLSEVAYWLGGEEFSRRVHDWSIPAGRGRA